MRGGNVWWVAMLVLASASCSWTVMSTLPAQPLADASYACDESTVAPKLDVAVAIVATAVTVLTVFATVDCGDGEPEQGCSTVGLGYYYVVPAILYGVSARHGFAEAGRCRAYHEGRPAMAGGQAPPPPPPHPQEGSVCERIPGVPRGGRCPRGLVCRGDICVR